MSENTLNTEDQKLRKKWLITTFFLFVVPPLLYLLLSLALANSNSPDEPQEATIDLCAKAATFGIFYFFTYKRFGNKFLTFVLVVTLISMIKDLVSGWRLLEGLVEVTLYALYIGLYVFWFKLSLRVCKANKRARFERSEAHEPVIRSFEEVHTLGELETTYTQLLNKWPKHKGIIKALYKEKKLSLPIE